MKKLSTLLTIVLLFSASSFVLAQNFKVSGIVSDASNGEKLIGATVMIKDLNTGATTDINGNYIIENIKEGVYEISVSYIGYSPKTRNIDIDKNLKVDFQLEPSSVLLNETVVKSTKAVLRETPVAFSDVKGADLEFKLASRDIPQELSTTPSVYSSASGGGAGDATLYVRGFSQRNVAVMVNGVPVNDMENKWVYWSNWAGLGDVLEDSQIQRGIGASPYSTNAVGGVLNMTTKGVGSEEEFAKVKTEYGSDNLIKGSISFHKKFSQNFAVTALFSRKNWDGYAVGTYNKEFSYFFAVGGVFGDHSIELRGVGSPQEHGQRPFSYARLTAADWEKYGRDFNYAMGRLQGGWINEAVNKFHKPQFNIDWNWQISKKSVLSTVVYHSIGRGYGSGTLGPFAPAISKAQDEKYQNYRDYDKVWSINSKQVDINYDAIRHRSTSTILRNSVNNHNWSGLLSTYKTELSPEFVLNVGIDGRYYIGEHYQEVRDLIGGDYYVDFKDVNGLSADKKKGKMVEVGGKVNYYNDFYVRQFGGFGQLEYKTGNLTTFINLSASSQGAKRLDYFLYLNSDPMRETEWQNFFGYTAKTGLNYNLDSYNQVYFNAGYFSSAPMVNNIFANNTNLVSNNARNEKVLGLELGYALSTKDAMFRANGFYTKWKDRAITISYSDLDPNTGDPVTKYGNISGSEQLHSGVEFEGVLRIMRGLELKGAASYVVGKFQNDVEALIAPENNPTAIKKVNLYVKELYVSEFPQQQANIQINYRINLIRGLNMFINPVYKFEGKNFASFNPDARTNMNDRTQSWELPTVNLVDFHLGFTYYFSDFFVQKANLYFHVFNVLNNKDYILDALDGGTSPTTHTFSTAKFFYGRERWYNVQVAFTF